MDDMRVSQIIAETLLSRRGFGFYTNPMDGGQDAYDISCDALEDARAALSALSDAGYVVAPREPTVKMMFAGMDAHYPGKYAYYPEEHESAEAAVNAAYRAMLSAAPAPK